jgi:hypothetical protein
MNFCRLLRILSRIRTFMEQYIKTDCGLLYQSIASGKLSDRFVHVGQEQTQQTLNLKFNSVFKTNNNRRYLTTDIT